MPKLRTGSRNVTNRRIDTFKPTSTTKSQVKKAASILTKRNLKKKAF